MLLLKLFGIFSTGIKLIPCRTNHRQRAHGVNLLGPHDECLLVKVRLRLFTLNGGAERFQVLLCVWDCVVCLWEWERQKQTKWVVTGSSQLIILFFLSLFHRICFSQKAQTHFSQELKKISSERTFIKAKLIITTQLCLTTTADCGQIFHFSFCDWWQKKNYMSEETCIDTIQMNTKSLSGLIDKKVMWIVCYDLHNPALNPVKHQ